MLLIMNQSVRFGLRPSMFSMAGCMAALMIMFTLSALGLGVVLQNAPAVFDALRWLGAVYLAYLGYKVWTAPVTPAPADRTAHLITLKQGFSPPAATPKPCSSPPLFCPNSSGLICHKPHNSPFCWQPSACWKFCGTSSTRWVA
jgi:LysE type translocator